VALLDDRFGYEETLGAVTLLVDVYLVRRR
jgi:hypothetical protein